MLKTVSILTHPPQRAKTRFSPGKAATNESPRHTFYRYVEDLSDVRT